MSDGDWSHWNELPVDEAFKYGTRYAVSDTMGSENMRFSIIRFDPGERGPLHYHNDPCEEYYMVLEGVLDITMGDEVVEADAGTVLYTPSEMRHYPENNTDEPAILLSVWAPKMPLADGVTVVEDVSTHSSG